MEKVPSLQWTFTQLFHRGDDYYDALAKDLRRARESITLETYILTIDKVTLVLLEELTAARKRGCHVQLLVDGFGSYFWLSQIRQYCQKNDLDLRIYHALPERIGWFKVWKLFRLLNKRNHRKVTIIDQSRAYLGSLNFTQVHSESALGPASWRDTGVVVQGPPVQMLVKAFAQAWRRAGQKRLRRFWTRRKNDRILLPEKTLVRLNSNPRMRYRVYRDMIRRLRTAEKRIYVTTAYFVPKRSLLRVLKNAARRGVDVQIIVPGVTDVPLVRWAAYAMVHTLIKAGVRISEYQGRVLHAKYMIIDDYCSVGSMNLNHRSLLHDLEVEVVLDHPKDLANMVEQWQTDRQNSRQLTESQLKATTWWSRLLSRIAFKLRYLL